MATYAIGDLQGCFRPFMALLEEIEFDADRDRLWLVGDLVNRGPSSLEVLRWCYANRSHVVTVLGNHDLYLLACYDGVSPNRVHESLEDILGADDGPQLVAWLRRQPLLHREKGWLMVHAGIHPSWTLEEAEKQARDLETQLQAGYVHVLRELLRPGTLSVPSDASIFEKRRFALTVMTQMRMLTRDGSLDSSYKGPLREAPAELVPWFSFRDRRPLAHTVIFGHWAGLGLHFGNDVVGLDSGCVWGRALTALRLDDRAVFKVPCSSSAGFSPIA